MGRFVASQHRYDPVIDFGKTNGFSTLDLRLGWKLKKDILLTAGVENLFDKYYYEHASKNFAFNQDGGYKTTDRIPGAREECISEFNNTFKYAVEE